MNEIYFARNDTRVLRLSGTETIHYPPMINEITDTLEFQRLRGFSQLGITHLVYPGATHNRFSHSLGVYDKCRQYISSLQRNSAFRELYFPEEIQSLVLLSVLHDVGHYPFAHYLEEIGGLSGLRIGHEYFSGKIITGDISVHQMADTEFSRKYFSVRRAEHYRKKTEEKPGISVFLTPEMQNGIAEIQDGKGKFRLLKDIIDGPIDCDKLDYLTRDSRYAGVPYGNMIDLDRFYNSLTLNAENYPEIRLGITSKGVSAVESIISSRYELFSEVYWHKTCRAATAMIKEAFWYAHHEISQDEFNWAVMLLDDQDFLKWIYEKLKDEHMAYDLLGGIEIFNDRNIYKRIRTYSSYWKEADKYELYQYFTTRLKNDFGLIHSYRNNLVKEINISGSKYPGWIPLRNHHLIIDIPNVHQDLYHHIKVSYPESVDGQRFYDLQDISFLSKSLYETFACSTKKVRILCHPDTLQQLDRLGKSLDIIIKEMTHETYHSVTRGPQ